MEKRINGWEKSKHMGLTSVESELAQSCGIEPARGSGSYVFVDNRKVVERLNEKYKGIVEIMDITDALKKYNGLKEYYWKLVDPNKNEFTKMAANPDGGYFIRIFKNQCLEIPLESCIILHKGKEQRLHNIVIAEEGSSVTIMSGCTAHNSLLNGLHVGVSEFFVGKNASVNFTMVHNWNETTTVRPITAIKVEEGGTFISNYLCMKSARDIKTAPHALCSKNSKAIFNTVLYGKKNSLIDIGEEIELNEDGSIGEINSRAILEADSKIITRGKIVGASKSKGHIECRGIVLSDRAELRSIPEIDAKNSGVDLSHEAAIGKIAEKELLYLMSRGLDKEKATSLIVSGFLNMPMPGVTEWVKVEIGKK
jgi:uncharacterized protein